MSFPPADLAVSSGRLRLLGPPCWEAAGHHRPLLLTQRGDQLRAWLAHRGDWVGRDVAAHLFWPDLPEADARRNLRKVLHRLNARPDPPVVEQRGALLRCAVPTDVQAFEQALDSGDLDGALALWRGPPWQGATGEWQDGLAEWLAFERSRLATRWRDAMLKLAAAQPARADDIGLRLLADDPLDEEALRLRLQALMQGGRPAEARAAHDTFARALQAALGLQPAAATTALLQAPTVAVHAGDAGSAASTAPATPAAASPPPGPPPALVGRRAEWRALDSQLCTDGATASRWVTLVGPGGAGKTALATAWAAARPAQGLPVRVVAFDDVGDDTAAARRLADALGAAAQAATDPYGAIGQALARAPALLVLDNLETVPGFAAALAPRLAATAGVRVLATSRMRLGVAGESLLPLQGLPWPGDDDLDRIEAFDAVRLFLACSPAAGPRLHDPAERQAVAQLCRRLEGLPLALELAATWTRHFRVTEILPQLGDLDAWAARPDGHAAGRHASLQACFDHSWSMLSPPERSVLAALGLLDGSFTLLTAREVAGATLPLMAALVDKSLLRRDTDGPRGAPARWSLHPLVQQFARARLQADPPAEARARQRLAAHACRILAALPPTHRYAERTATLAHLLADRETLVAGWREAVASGRGDLLRPALTPLRALHHTACRWDEAVHWMTQALPLLGGDPQAEAEVALARALAAFFTGEPARARAEARRAMPALGGPGHGPLRRDALVYAGYADLALGEVAAAEAAFEAGLSSARDDGDLIATAMFLGALADLDMRAGRHARSCARQREAVALRGGVETDRPLLLSNLARALVAAGELDEARQVIDDGLAACRDTTLGLVAPYLWLYRAEVALRQRRLADGRADLARALALAPAGTVGGVRLELAFWTVRAALAGGDADAAWQALAPATDLALAGHTAEPLARAAALWGRASALAGHATDAATWLTAALAAPELTGIERDEATAARAALPAAALVTAPVLPPGSLRQWLQARHAVAPPTPAGRASAGSPVRGVAP